MKRFIFAALAFALIASAPAFATEKSTADLQADLLTYKTRSFNADANYSNLVNLSDSMFNKTTDDLRDITGLSGLADAELGYIDITTLGTAAASKALTFDASLDAIIPTGGLITFQSGGQITMASGSTLSVGGTFSGATLTLTGDLSGDGGDQFFGFLQDQVASTTAAVTAAQVGKTFVSDSADVMTLPEASTVLGARYTFVCGTADDFDINPADATDVIGTVASITGANTTTVLAPAAGDAIRCTDIGSSIVIEAVGADLWASIGTANGVWTDVN